MIDGHSGDVVADLLVMDNGSRELRRLASDLGVSRERGDTKRRTAERIVAQAPNALSIEELGDGLLELNVDRRRTADPSSTPECPSCGGLMLITERGGARCLDCGYSKR